MNSASQAMQSRSVNVPESFKCPITHEVMEYPCTTKAGNSYEYMAIENWLKNHNTDPLSGQVMQSKAIVPNNTLRSQIVSWFEQHPDASSLRNCAAKKPPAFSPTDNEAASGLEKVLRYRGKLDADDGKQPAAAKRAVPQAFCEYGHSYEFAPSPDIDDGILVRCNGGPWIEAPDKAMFASPSGVVFFDPSEVRDTRVLPGTVLGGAKLCKFGNGCSADGCPDVHAFVCARGAGCAGQGPRGQLCKFLHPAPESVVPLGRE